MSGSLRQIGAAMETLAKPGAKETLRSMIGYHRMPNQGRGMSARELARRHGDVGARALLFLSYNTYLLEARIQLPSDLGSVKLEGKPELGARATELGQMIATEGYDFVSLYEVMQEKQKDDILAAIGRPVGHVFGGINTSLFAISPTCRFTRTDRLRFVNDAKKSRIKPLLGPGFDISLDADFYANKGVLLTEIDTGLRARDGAPIHLEFYSTHLMWGGGLEDLEGTVNALTVGDHISASNPGERFTIQMRQIDELVQFFRAKHNRTNVAILCGDFNIDGSNPAHYAELSNRLGTIGLRDAWLEGPYPVAGNAGQTCRNDDGKESPRETDFSRVCAAPSRPDAGDYCDELNGSRSNAMEVGRFDYLFIEEPTDMHACNVDFSRVRRRQFRRPHPTGGQDFLSDHLGLETTLFVSVKA